MRKQMIGAFLKRLKPIFICLAVLTFLVGFTNSIHKDIFMSNTENEPLTEEDWQKFPEFMRQHPEVVEADKEIMLKALDADSELPIGHVTTEEHVTPDGETWTSGHVFVSHEEARELGIQGYDRFVEWLRGQE